MDEVEEWLGILGLQQYVDAFKREEIDMEALPLLTAEDLVSLGVTDMTHRHTLLANCGSLSAVLADATNTEWATREERRARKADKRARRAAAADLDLALALSASLAAGQLPNNCSQHHQCAPDTQPALSGEADVHTAKANLIGSTAAAHSCQESYNSLPPSCSRDNESGPAETDKITLPAPTAAQAEVLDAVSDDEDMTECRRRFVPPRTGVRRAEYLLLERLYPRHASSSSRSHPEECSRTALFAPSEVGARVRDAAQPGGPPVSVLALVGNGGLGPSGEGPLPLACTRFRDAAAAAAAARQAEEVAVQRQELALAAHVVQEEELANKDLTNKKVRIAAIKEELAAAEQLVAELKQMLQDLESEDD